MRGERLLGDGAFFGIVVADDGRDAGDAEKEVGEAVFGDFEDDFAVELRGDVEQDVAVAGACEGEVGEGAGELAKGRCGELVFEFLDAGAEACGAAVGAGLAVKPFVAAGGALVGFGAHGEG